MKRSRMMLGLGVLAAAWTLVISRSGADQPAGDGPVQIGMVETLFVDVPRPLVNILALPFGNLMKQQTGVDGRLVIAGDAFHVAKLLHEDKYQIGIFQGIEFAWAQKKYADLQPLMIAVSKHHTLHANLVTSQQNKAGKFVDLKGKNLALPQRSKEHLRQFLKKGCTECGQAAPEAFFGQIVRPTSTEDALDEVCAGTIEAAIVDQLDLESYKDIKPGCFKQLKVVQQSEPFPTGVIAVHKGALSDKILEKFRDGMVDAKNNLQARELMALFHLTAFEAVPANFEETVTNILRFYPPPEPATAKTAANP